MPALLGFFQTDTPGNAPDHREKLAIPAFTLHGLFPEDGSQLSRRFADVLAESNRFQISLVDSLKDSERSSDPQFLADAGKALGVQKIVQVDVVRRVNHFVLRIRLVNVSDAALLYAERADYSGEFGSLLADVIPEQARKLSKAHLDAKTPWAKAAFLFGGCLVAILWVFWHFSRKNTIQGDSST
jgi:hypothetical protein